MVLRVAEFPSGGYKKVSKSKKNLTFKVNFYVKSHRNLSKYISVAYIQYLRGTDKRVNASKLTGQ